MLKINIICVGKIKEEFYSLACDEYKKRLGKFCQLDIFEISETYLPPNPSKAQIENAFEKEAVAIKNNIKGYVFVCDINSNQYSSEEFSNKIEKLSNTNSTISFVIGGSYGMSQKIKDIANEKISFSKATFPHHLARVILLEQIYRAFCILNNITYHK